MVWASWAVVRVKRWDMHGEVQYEEYIHIYIVYIMSYDSAYNPLQKKPLFSRKLNHIFLEIK